MFYQKRRKFWFDHISQSKFNMQLDLDKKASSWSICDVQICSNEQTLWLFNTKLNDIKGNKEQEFIAFQKALQFPRKNLPINCQALPQSSLQSGLSFTKDQICDWPTLGERFLISNYENVHINNSSEPR
jgi:hypothetical protein